MTAHELAALHAKCFTTPRPWSASEFAGLGDSTYLLTKPQGFLMGRTVLDEAELLTLAVDPDMRRQGIARGLVEGFKTRATEGGAVTAFLEVAANNAAAVALYHATGFVHTGRRRGYYRQPDGTTLDAIVLRCPLDER